MNQTVTVEKMVKIQYLEETRAFDVPVQEYCDSYQIHFQLKGKRYLFFDRSYHTMAQGEVAVLKPFQIFYSEIRDGEADERYVIQFRPEVLDDILDEEEKKTLLEKLCFGVMRLSEGKIERLYHKFLQAEEYIKNPGFLSEKLLAMAVMQLIMTVVDCEEEEEQVEVQRVMPQMERILDYIQENYQKNLTLEQMAKTAGISKFYFCRMFRKITGATAVEYINYVRLIHAHRLLVETTIPVEEIARRTGLSSSTNLARIFKKIYGMSPSNFRKENGKYMPEYF